MDQELLRIFMAARFKAARQAAGLSRKQLARRLGLDRAHIARQERPHSLPTVRRVLEVARVTGVSVSALLDEGSCTDAPPGDVVPPAD